MESFNVTASKLSLKSLSILIADDDEPTRMLLNAALSQKGYALIEAADGEEAWEILQVKKPDLLILDWLMPKLDGIELCRRIRSELSYRPYIIMLTQVAGTTNIIKGLEAGADEFLSKPFNIAELHNRILVGSRILKYEARFLEQISLLEMQSVFAQQMLVEIEAIAEEGISEKQKLAELNKIIDMLKDNLKKMVNQSW